MYSPGTAIATFPLFDSEVILKAYTYANQRIALAVVAQNGEPMGTLSVNIPEIPLDPNEVFVKTWSENEVMREPALACGALTDTGKRVQLGHCVVELWKLTKTP